MPHQTQNTNLGSARVCTDPPAESTVHYILDGRSTVVAVKLPACSQAEKPPVAQPWPLLVELRPARRRELVKRSQRLTKTLGRLRKLTFT